MTHSKQDVFEFWNAASCGESLFLEGQTVDGYMAQLRKRYEIEPYILDFAEFDRYRGKSVLEIGVGLGADHQMWAQAGVRLTGIDLTDRAVGHVRQRFDQLGLTSELAVGDAEQLTFSDATFDVVYSWGVLHHSPNTPRAIDEVYRVLKPGGVAKIMVYHTWSIVGLLLWVRYALFRGKPFTSLKTIYSRYLESPGTKAYSVAEARQLFCQFETVDITIELSSGDVLDGHVGQRHSGFWLSLAKQVVPRRFIRRFFSKCGLFMLISATK